MAERRKEAVMAIFFLVAMATVGSRLVFAQDSTAPRPTMSTMSSTFANFENEFTAFWAPDHIQTTSGQELTVLLNNVSGAGFGSKGTFLFGRINMNLKLIGGDSSGTVTTYYLTSGFNESDGAADEHDELDFEFLGNRSGEPYILQTNVFASGHGEREQRIFLWFDPSEDFHSYSVLWNKNIVIFEVDGIPIRIFKNNEAMGLPYLNARPMQVSSSIWNGDSWATEGGRIKVNWTYSPFVATFQSYNYDACEWIEQTSPPCAASTANNWWEGPPLQSLTSAQAEQLKKIQADYMVYDYCTDFERFNYVTPPECATNLSPFFLSSTGSALEGPTSAPRSNSSSRVTRAHWSKILIGLVGGIVANFAAGSILV